MKTVFEINLMDEVEVRKLRDLLNFHLEQLTSHNEEENLNLNGSPDDATASNITTLKQFISEASDNQLTVLRWMKKHPGPVSADKLKTELPFLDGHGKIPGVFRPGRWIRIAGSKAGFPFLQIHWDRQKGCGTYRGLTQDEANLLDI